MNRKQNLHSAQGEGHVELFSSTILIVYVSSSVSKAAEARSEALVNRFQ